MTRVASIVSRSPRLRVLPSLRTRLPCTFPLGCMLGERVVFRLLHVLDAALSPSLSGFCIPLCYRVLVFFLVASLCCFPVFISCCCFPFPAFFLW